MVDVSDATFEAEVIERSKSVPVVVDLWAPWCGPCRQLGPMIEDAVAATEGKVVLAKVNVDENPGVSASFQVKGIPAVYALHDGAVVDGFVGAQGRDAVTAFVEALLPSEAEDDLSRLVAAGDEASLGRALELDPGHEPAVVALAELLVGDGRADDALELLGRIPESATTRRIAAVARTGGEVHDVDARLDDLLDRAADDDDARQELIDLLEVLGPDDPRTATYRRALTTRLF